MMHARNQRQAAKADEVEQRLAGGAGWDFSLLPVGRAECKDRKSKRHNTTLPAGANEGDIKATYDKGILIVDVAVPEQAAAAAAEKHIAVQAAS